MEWVPPHHDTQSNRGPPIRAIRPPNSFLPPALRNRCRDEDSIIKNRKNLQDSNLMQILKRRGVADDVRHLRIHHEAPLRSGGTLERQNPSAFQETRALAARPDPPRLRSIVSRSQTTERRQPRVERHPPVPDLSPEQRGWPREFEQAAVSCPTASSRFSVNQPISRAFSRPTTGNPR